MRVRRLEESGDLATSGVIWKDDKECIAQCIQTRLRLFLGEYFRDVSEGMPWFDKLDGSPGILCKGYPMSQVESLIWMRIARTDGVLKILAFHADYDMAKRSLSVRATVFTRYGAVEVTYGTTDI